MLKYVSVFSIYLGVCFKKQRRKKKLAKGEKKKKRLKSGFSELIFSRTGLVFVLYFATVSFVAFWVLLFNNLQRYFLWNNDYC